MLVNELHQGGIRALLDWDSTILDGMILPEGIDQKDVIDHIIYKYGDAPLFSPDPETIRFYTARWSKRRLPLWERYKKAIETEYNPLENYDRMEHKEYKHGKKVTYEGTVTDDTSGSIIQKTDDVSTDGISADNSSTFEPDKNSVLDGTQVTSYDELELKRTLDHTDTASGKDEEESRIHGNIGVTTSQQMLTAEVTLIRDNLLDLIDYIADDWHSEFNLMIYT